MMGVKIWLKESVVLKAVDGRCRTGALSVAGMVQSSLHDQRGKAALAVLSLCGRWRSGFDRRNQPRLHAPHGALPDIWLKWAADEPPLRYLSLSRCPGDCGSEVGGGCSRKGPRNVRSAARSGCLVVVPNGHLRLSALPTFRRRAAVCHRVWALGRLPPRRRRYGLLTGPEAHTARSLAAQARGVEVLLCR